MPVDQVAEAICARAGLAIQPADSPLRVRLRRYGTSARHIRLPLLP